MNLLEKIDLYLNVTESIKSEIENIFKGDSRYKKLKSKAKDDEDKQTKLLDYIVDVIGIDEIEKLSKKYKKDYDIIAKEILN